VFLDQSTGRLIDAQTGAAHDRAAIQSGVSASALLFQQRGLTPGDRVLINYGNRPEFFLDLLAIWRSGACAIPLDARATATEIANIVAATGPKLSLWHEAPPVPEAAALTAAGVRVVTADDRRATASPAQPGATFRLDDDALILFTSGTTGQPKGVVHTHRSLLARWVALRESLGTADFERTLCLLPTHFGHGLICNSLFPWLSGQDLFILPPFRTDLLLGLGALIDRHRITFMSSVPPVWRIALKMARQPTLGSLRRVFCGSAPLSRHLWQGIREWTGTPQVCNAYGITETGSWVAGLTDAGIEPEDGLIGRGWGTIACIRRRGDTAEPPDADDECAAGEEGFVWLKTPGLMRGYLGRDDLTAQVVVNGWFSTGDIGVVDDRGLLYLRGRQREEINKGGMKIFPADVDAVIERHAGVLDVCTFAFEQPLYGEDVGVAVVLQQGDPANLAALHAWTEAELGAHRLPARWYLLDEIPRTSRGKINRESVAGSCAEREPIDRGVLAGRDAGGDH
jgi:acyl-CoA synthetase (AMP-forming)/AMP-acid ligase II